MFGKLLHPLNLEEYRMDIQLDTPYEKKSILKKDTDGCDICDVINKIIERPQSKHENCWRELRGLLNVMQPQDCARLCENKPLLEEIESVILSQNQTATTVDSIECASKCGHSFVYSNKVGIWKGDITTLKVDSIVNACNSALLGCFSPNHKCIDNAIHTFAGPQLRRDCYTIITKQGFDEPTAIAKITRGYCLPSKYVIHTVGPIVEEQLEEKHINLLRANYVSCLDLADDMKLKSIAFCGISTGIYGFPAKEAALVAVKSVLSWLLDNPQTSIEKVVFDCFTPKDVEYYENAFSVFDKSANEKDFDIVNRTKNKTHVLTEEDSKNMIKVVNFLKDATHVVIGAGAGFSVDAGIDFMNTKYFRSFGYPLYEYGITKMLETIGFHDFNEESQFWGFFAVTITEMRYKPLTKENRYYKQLLDTLNQLNKKYFIKTTNVDGLFERSGFEKDKVFHIQGDMNQIQCSKACTDEVYEFKPICEEMLLNIDPTTFCIDEKYIPKCPRCGGKMTFNLREDDLFVDGPNLFNQKEYIQYVGEGMNDKMILFEFGVGRGTPVHIRFPFEKYANKGKNVLLVRINMDKDLLLTEVDKDNYAGFGMSGKEFIEEMVK
ncbi:hypothetical protein EIN_118830 [Entamoeba invadens IP1]|uniref:Uncharacterized protein n=1 Tax=Entamoeba invadens IP1 TaxID=370355 RepID=L7FNL5_ENTIV|nr:hypothetical protein EIN_118830 [Entamoeba invadens IP1]ELP92269.1 hypothetical protein EIN_118830 [Entamoeba invadens IP1]|eukprot:XP_004259040.1 hypothetical protein EIN_118830 [Entamoeba invadens IP1]